MTHLELISAEQLPQQRSPLLQPVHESWEQFQDFVRQQRIRRASKELLFLNSFTDDRPDPAKQEQFWLAQDESHQSLSLERYDGDLGYRYDLRRMAGVGRHEHLLISGWADGHLGYVSRLTDDQHRPIGGSHYIFDGKHYEHTAPIRTVSGDILKLVGLSRAVLLHNGSVKRQMLNRPV